MGGRSALRGGVDGLFLLQLPLRDGGERAGLEGGAGGVVHRVLQLRSCQGIGASSDTSGCEPSLRRDRPASENRVNKAGCLRHESARACTFPYTRFWSLGLSAAPQWTNGFPGS